MEATHLLLFIPTNADNVEYYFDRAGNRDLWRVRRIFAVVVNIICSMGNVVLYSFDWALKKVTVYIFLACGKDKEDLEHQMAEISSNLYKSRVFVAKAVSAFYSNGVGGFSIPVKVVVPEEVVVQEEVAVPEGVELNKELLKLFNMGPSEIDRVGGEILRHIILVNDERVMTLERLKICLRKFLRWECVEQILPLCHLGIYENSYKLVEGKIKDTYGSRSQLPPNTSEPRWLFITKVGEMHIKVESFIQYQTCSRCLNNGRVREIPFKVACKYTIDWNFRSSANRAPKVHYTLTSGMK